MFALSGDFLRLSTEGLELGIDLLFGVRGFPIGVEGRSKISP
jgi:hypothetical protein